MRHRKGFRLKGPGEAGHLATNCRLLGLLLAWARYYWIGPCGQTGNALSPAIAIPSITSRAISSQNFPTGMSAYFLRV